MFILVCTYLIRPFFTRLNKYSPFKNIIMLRYFHTSVKSCLTLSDKKGSLSFLRITVNCVYTTYFRQEAARKQATPQCSFSSNILCKTSILGTCVYHSRNSIIAVIKKSVLTHFLLPHCLQRIICSFIEHLFEAVGDSLP